MMALDQTQVTAWFQSVNARTADVPPTLTRLEYEAWCMRCGIDPRPDRDTGMFSRGEFCYDNDPDGASEVRRRINSARHAAVRAEALLAAEARQTARAGAEAARPQTGHCWECGRLGAWNDAEHWYACDEHWNG